MNHRDRHPTYVDGCDACRWGTVGVQTRQIKGGADPVRHKHVIVEDGPRRGTIGGYHTEHWDGRQDATIHAPSTRLVSSIDET